MSTAKVRFGLIGCGDFGPMLAEYIASAAEVVAICDPSPHARAEFLNKTGLNPRQFSDHRDLLREANLDAVAITSPNHTHRMITIDAAGAGKHVFCEKAMAPTVPDCWEMVRACDGHGVRLMIGHKRRLRPPWARMVELREHLGDVVALSSCLYFDGRPYYNGWWTRGDQSGGTLFAAGVHIVDWMRAMCGDVKTVRALAGLRVDARYDYPDTLHLWLEFQSGAIGSLDVSLSFYAWHFREAGGPRVVCRNGSMRLDSFLDHIDIHWQRSSDKQALHERFDDLGFEHAFTTEIRDFITWMTTGEPPCLTWIEGLRCVEVMEAARRSADAGGSTIPLPLYPELERSI